MEISYVLGKGKKKAMLHDFLEKNIQNKLNILYVMHARRFTSIRELNHLLKLSNSGIHSLIAEINWEIHGYGSITRDASSLQLIFNETSDISTLLHLVCRSSSVLHCLKFFITNEAGRSFTAFSEQEFLSTPSAYRIRNACRSYLLSVGLNLSQNTITGEEYRIRFLISMLYYKYGIDCGYFDEASIQTARNFILQTNQKINLDYLSHASIEHGYFECLLILFWKRKDHPVQIPKREYLEKLKTLFIYEKLTLTVQTVLHPDRTIPFSEDDFDYLYLAYFCTNNCLFADQWQEQDLAQMHSILFSEPKFQDLACRFHPVFTKKTYTLVPLQATLIYFYKKCFLELYCLIPDEHFYLYSQKNETTQRMYQLVSTIIGDWKAANQLTFAFDQSHLYYLSLQLEFLLYQAIEPIPVYLLSDLRSELKVMTLYLKNQFASGSAAITPLLIHTEHIDFLNRQENSIILAPSHFSHYLSAQELIRRNTFIPISVEISQQELKAIQEALLHYKTLSFLEHIRSLSESESTP